MCQGHTDALPTMFCFNKASKLGNWWYSTGLQKKSIAEVGGGGGAHYDRGSSTSHHLQTCLNGWPAQFEVKGVHLRKGTGFQKEREIFM